MTGKEKCEVLKKIRRDIVAANDLDVEITDCKHTGDCRGTCPKCEAETKQIEKELGKKKKLGIRVAVAGISAALITGSFSSCKQVLNPQPMGDYPNVDATESLEGEIAETEIETGEGNECTTSPDELEVAALAGDVAAPDTFDDNEPDTSDSETETADAESAAD